MSAPDAFAALGPRLATVARAVPAGAAVADVGTDHAKLPTLLLAAGVATRAWALDISDGPSAALRARVLPPGLVARQGDGLQPLAPGEADTVTVCGMGGHSIAHILRDAPAGVWAGLRRLVLQPNDHPAEARRALCDRGWGIVDEHMVEERGRWYPVVVAAPTGGWRGPATPAALHWGPLLLARADPGLLGVLRREQARLDKILARVPTAAKAGRDRALVAAGLAHYPGEE